MKENDKIDKKLEIEGLLEAVNEVKTIIADIRDILEL